MKKILVLLLAYCAHTNAEHSLRRRLSQDYSINKTTFDVNDPDILLGKLTLSNEIGHSVSAGNVQVILMDYLCAENKSSTGLEVELFSSPYTNLSEPFTYLVQVDRGLLSTAPGGFVNYTDPSGSKSAGDILFCTRVSTFNSGIQVSYRDSSLSLPFNMANSTFNITGIGGAVSNTIGSIDTQVTDSFGIATCQCDGSFNCLIPLVAVPQNQVLDICITPTAFADADNVRITNFNLRISTTSGDVDYDPVSLGATTWDPDVLTRVTPEAGTGKLKITLTIIADFYVLTDDTTVDLKGNAFLEFQSQKEATVTAFGMTLPIVNEPEKAAGCLQKFFAQFFRG